jgi:Fusaric acid resistance protein-like
MRRIWYRDLYRIDSVVAVRSVIVRVLLAVGVPLLGGVLLGHRSAAVAGGATALFVTLSDIGSSARARLGTMFAALLMILAGGALGHMIGDTPYTREAVVLGCALLAGWASVAHPGIAVVTRFFAVAAAAATGMRFADPDVLASVVVGGISAFASAVLVWRLSGMPPQENVMDWRAGVRRAFYGSGAGLRFAFCYAAAAAVALFAAGFLRVKEPFWATLVVLMVMRREGLVSFELTIHYVLGTILGVVIGAVALRYGQAPLTLAVLATLVAAFARVGFAINPSLGYMAFTMFLLFVTHLGASGAAALPHLLETRLYDVCVGCILALAGTLLATYPHLASPAAPASLRRPS